MTDKTNAELADEIERQINSGDAAVRLKSGQWDQIIAALRRQPSSDQVLVPIGQREAFHMTYNGGYAEEATRSAFHHGMNTVFNWLDSLSAAEAEGRKPCPLCGRSEPHSHTSGPLGMS